MKLKIYLIYLPCRVGLSYELNVCVLSQIHRLIPNPQCDQEVGCLGGNQAVRVDP